jgi:urease accessory protein
MSTALHLDAGQLAAVLQLASPALPIGAFSYSQGLEAAVNAKVVIDENGAGDWIKAQFKQSFLPRELFSLQAAFGEMDRASGHDIKVLQDIDAAFVASRDGAEARLETRQLGSSLCRWLGSVSPTHEMVTVLASLRSLQNGNVSSPVAFAGVAKSQGLSLELARLTWAFSWLENQVQAAVKLVPLGQSSGQRLLLMLRPLCAMETPTKAWSCAPMASLLMMRHERQYSRLFRS